jgi:hypothetical protein
MGKVWLTGLIFASYGINWYSSTRSWRVYVQGDSLILTGKVMFSVLWELSQTKDQEAQFFSGLHRDLSMGCLTFLTAWG